MQSVAAFSTPRHYVLHRQLMTDRFEDIRTFITVVQAKSFAGAAERLAVAKSAISRRVSDLEDRLGTRLLHRTTREVSLTEAGADFYDRGLKLLADLEETEDLASKGRNNPFGKLRVTAPCPWSWARCLRAIPGFRFRWNFSTDTRIWSEKGSMWR
jgi:DNA-binding transcriptional LysR family regulator